MEKIVISGINLIDGGALSVYYDFLDTLIEKKYYDKYKIIALIGNKKLFGKYEGYIEFIEFPKSKKSWIYRLYYEYIFFKKFSKKILCDYWISLHDITPNVIAKKRFVYCHNPSPFNKMKISEIKYGFKYYLFSKFYKYLYKINIRKNTGIIVQQEWIRKEFEKIFKVDNVIVARPSIPNIDVMKKSYRKNDKIIFIYPSYPRYYKNFEIVCEATKILSEEHINNFEVLITVNGTENRYSRDLVKKYNNINNLKFIGLLDRKELYKKYGESSCLIFMSKLETWGMPIIEYKKTRKPMIVSDLPYAYETVGDYEKVIFSNVDNAAELAEKMKFFIQTNKIDGKNKLIKYKEPFAKDWNELLEIIIKKDGER